MTDKPSTTQELANSVQQPQASKTDQSQTWQSLSPISIVYFVASSIKNIVSNAFVLIPILALNYKAISQHPSIVLPIVLGLLGLLTLFAVISFKVYRYRLTSTNVEIRSGIINKKHLNLPFERVQNVKIEQPIYYRLSGHACLQLDTAGSAKDEAKIIALKKQVAESLKVSILQQAHTAIPTPSSQSNDDALQHQQISQEVTLNRRSLGDLVIHGITSNRIWIFLGGLAPFLDDIMNSAGDWAKLFGLDFENIFSLQTHSMLEIVIYAVSLTLIILLVLVSFSVLGSVISFYDYRLSRQDNKYIRRSGLLTKHEVTMQLSRLQVIVRKQDWLDLLLRRINLKFEQNNATHQQQGQSALLTSKIIVPSVKEHECHELIKNAYPNNTLSSIMRHKRFSKISKQFLVRNIGILLTPLWLIGSTVCIYFKTPALMLITSSIYGIACLLTYMRWRRWGYAADNQFIYVRKGVIGIDYYCFPIYKVQQVKFLQSVFIKPKQLASVQFVLASGNISIPFMPQNAARRLIDDSLYQVESSHKSWM